MCGEEGGEIRQCVGAAVEWGSDWKFACGCNQRVRPDVVRQAERVVMLGEPLWRSTARRSGAVAKSGVMALEV